MLVHDFSDSDSTAVGAAPFPPTVPSGIGTEGGVSTPLPLTGEYSITLNGTCSVVRDGETFFAHTHAR